MTLKIRLNAALSTGAAAKIEFAYQFASLWHPRDLRGVVVINVSLSIKIVLWDQVWLSRRPRLDLGVTIARCCSSQRLRCRVPSGLASAAGPGRS